MNQCANHPTYHCPGVRSSGFDPQRYVIAFPIPFQHHLKTICSARQSVECQIPDNAETQNTSDLETKKVLPLQSSWHSPPYSWRKETQRSLPLLRKNFSPVASHHWCIHRTAGKPVFPSNRFRDHTLATQHFINGVAVPVFSYLAQPPVPFWLSGQRSCRKSVETAAVHPCTVATTSKNSSLAGCLLCPLPCQQDHCAKKPIAP